MSKKKSFETLQNHFGERWSVSLSDIENHGRSESYFPIYAPDAVVYPITTEDVVFLVNICQEANIPLIEDAAHSLGTTWHGKKIGTLGDIGCFSFQSYKMLNAGEGGIFITDDPDLFAKAVNL